MILFERQLGSREWIQRTCTRSLEIGDIPGYHGELMLQAGGSDQVVDYW
jgi:hypothetical protein